MFLPDPIWKLASKEGQAFTFMLLYAEMLFLARLDKAIPFHLGPSQVDSLLKKKIYFKVVLFLICGRSIASNYGQAIFAFTV